MQSLVGVFLIFGAAIAARVHPDILPIQGIQNRIAGGEIAKSMQIPYQARLNLKMINEYGFASSALCGGSLISDRVILTAAHCLYHALSATVYLGTTDLQVQEPTRIAINVSAKSFVINRGFRYGGYDNDIAMIILPKSVNFNDGIQPVNIPKSDMSLEGRMGIISGYGKTEDYNSASVLRVVPRKILPQSFCQSSWTRQYNATVHLCVSSAGGKSACGGDSGGPLIIQDSDGSKVLVGLTSFGSPYCPGGSPTVYTKISKYLDWIRKWTP